MIKSRVIRIIESATRIIFVLVAVFISSYALAQQTVQIGTGAFILNGKLPTSGNYSYGWSAQIYKESEMQNKVGKITSLAFNIANTLVNYTMTNQKVYLAIIPDSAFTSTTYIDPTAIGATLVYNGTVSWNGIGWSTVNLNGAPFYYSGGNLLVLWEHRQGTWSQAYPQFKATNSPQINMVKYSYGGSSFPSTTGMYKAQRSDIKITLNQNLMPANDLAVDAWLSPNSGSAPDTAMTIKIRIKNSGTASQNSFVVKYSVNQGASFISELVTDTINSFGTKDYSFIIKANMGTPSLYNCIAVVQNTGDVNVNNDSIYTSLWIGNPLNGTYTIGYDTSDDFGSVSSACEALQNLGVSGPVTFLLDDTTFNEQIAISDSISGASLTNRITFKGHGINTLIQHIVANGLSDNTTCRISNASYITIDSIAFNAGVVNSTDNVGVYICDANYITIRNCNISVPITSSSHTNTVLVTSLTDIYTGNYFKNLTLENNVMNGGRYGIKIMGLSISNKSDSVIIKGNTITNQFTKGIFLENVKNYVIDHNTTISSAIMWHQSMNVKYCRYGIISNNNIINNSPYQGYGIYLLSNIGMSNSTLKVYNNMISIPNSTNDTYGIYVFHGKYLDFFHNTIRLGSGGVNSSALYIEGAASATVFAAVRIKNNILTNYGDGYAIVISNPVFPTYVTDCDYNNLYTTGSRFAKYGTYLKANLTAWKAISNNLGTHSKSVDPNYTSIQDLHVGGVEMSDGGTPVGILYDIDDSLRNLTTPDIGADEYHTAAKDLAVTSWISPLNGVSTGSPNQVKVQIINLGNASQSNFPINYSIDGGQTIVTEIISGPLNSLDSMIHTFTAPANFLSCGYNHCLAYTSLSGEEKPFNDTIHYDVLVCSSLSGIVTLGNDTNDTFESFNELSDVLALCGISGPLTVLVDSGLFDENVTFYSVPGASATNTITIKGYGSQSIVSNSKASYGDAFIFSFDGAKHYIIDSLKIQRDTSVDYFWGVHFWHHADSNTIKNCIIDCGSEASTNFNGIVSSNSLDFAWGLRENANGVVIDNNLIIGGYHGIRLNGVSYARSIDNHITNNILKNQSNSGVYVECMDSAEIRGNIINSGINTDSNAIAIYAKNGVNGLHIIGNNINYTKGKFGIYMYYHNYANSNQDTALVANNIIRVNKSSTKTPIGIYNYVSTRMKYYNNSINLTGNNDTNSQCFRLEYSLTTDIKNNIFVNNTGGYAFYTTDNGLNFSNNYNNLYTNGSKFCYYYGDKSDLASWQTATSDASNSISVDPEFISDSNLHTYCIPMMNQGKPISLVNNDIDGELRDTLSPDIGADEYDPLANNLGTIGFVFNSKPWCSTTDSLFVIIKNYGLNTQYNIPVKYVGNSPNGTITIITQTIDSIQSLEIDTVNLGLLSVSTMGLYNGQAFTALLNDSFPQNDTLNINMEVYYPDSANYFEEFTSINPIHWDMNGDGTFQWENYGNSAAKANFLSKSSGKTCEMISPVVFIPINKPSYVGFKYSFKNNLLAQDSLEIYVKSACDTSSWVRIWVKGGSDLSTANTSFSTPYVYNEVNTIIPASMQGSKIRVMFRGISDNGSDLFIDNMGVFTKPEVYIGPDTVICTGNSVSLDAGNFVHASYLWKRGVDTLSTLQLYNASIAGTYVAQVTQYGLVDYDTIILTDITPIITFTGLDSSYCENGLASVLVPSISGAIFSGIGVNGANFDPSVASVGAHVISCYYTSAQGCTGVTKDTTIVYPKPIISFSGLDSTYCDNETVDTLIPNISGGVFIGNGIIDSLFNPSISGLGQQIITYSYTTIHGCSDTLADTTIVYHAPLVSFTGLDSIYCDNESVDTLIPNLSGGAFYGNGITDSIFDPTNSGLGQQIITYSYTTIHGCSDTAADTTIVYHAPLVSFTGLDSIYCDNESVDTLIPNISGGAFSGNGITDSIFDPTNSGLGQQLITYTYTSANGCNSEVVEITNVKQSPQVFLGNDTTIKWSWSIILDAGNPNSDWLWNTGTMNQTQLFDSTNLQNALPNTVWVRVNKNGCLAYDTIIIIMENDVSISPLVNSMNSLNMKVYPNPTQGLFNLTLDGYKGKIQIEIVNINGQILQTKQIELEANRAYKSEFDLRGMSKGVYYIRLKSKDGSKIARIIIQ